MNRKNFILDSKSLKIVEMLNKDFLEIEIYAIAEGENVNNSNFLLSSMEKAIPTFYNKFILGYFNTHYGNACAGEGNFEEHNADVKYDSELNEYYYSYTAPNAEKALGIIRESDKVEIVDYEGKKWIRLTAAILTKYNREAVKHLLKSKKKRKISVEITVNKYHTENGIDIIEDFTLDGITILGNRKNSSRECEEGIKGANLKILNFLQSEVFNTQRKALSFAYQSLDHENTNEHEEEINMQQKTEEMEGKVMNDMETQETIHEQSEENKTEEFVSETEEFVETEDKKDTNVTDETECKECHDEHEDEENKEDDKEDDKEEKCTSVEDTKEECEYTEDEKEEVEYTQKETEVDNQESEEENKEEDKVEDAEKEAEVSEEVYTVNFDFGDVVCPSIEVQSNLKQYVEAHNQLTKEYQEVKDRYNQILTETKNTQLFEFGETIIADEKSLDKEIQTNIVGIFKEKCMASTFADEEVVKEYVITEIAKAMYSKFKEDEAKILNSKEFTAKIPTHTEKNVAESSFDKMKKILNMM